MGGCTTTAGRDAAVALLCLLLFSGTAGAAGAVEVDLEVCAPAAGAAPLVNLDVGAAGGSSPLLRSGTTLTGTLRVPGRLRPPAVLRITLESAGRQALHPPCALLAAVLSCAVGEEGRFACPMPAGFWDLTVDAEGWTAHQVRGRSSAPGGVVDLGPVTLRPGAALLGVVTTADGPVDPRSARVWAIPLPWADPPFEPATLDDDHAARRAVLGPRGEFALRNLPAGRYVVVAHQPGYSVHDLTQVDLRTGEETVLPDPILLVPPMRMLVELAPAVDPRGAPWVVELARERPGRGDLRPVASGPAAGGRWRATGLAAGTYVLSLSDSEDRRWQTEGPLHLDPMDGREVYLPLTIDVVEVEGTVRLGDDPLPAAEIVFGGRSGMRSIETTSGEDGAYRAALPGAGEWRVEIEAAEPPVTHQDRVEVPDRGGHLDLELPDTRLAGRVVDAEGGVPTPAPRVLAVRLDDTVGSMPVRVEADATFEARGLAPGTYEVSASNGEGASAAVTVDVTDDFDPPQLTLVLRRLRSAEGVVYTEQGGVAGAEVTALPLSPTGELLGPPFPSVDTDGAGRFRLELPQAATAVDLWVMAPGFGFAVERRPLDDLGVRVAPAGGVLRLPVVTELAGGELPFVMIDGTPIAFHALNRWAAMNGVSNAADADRATVPAMPAGLYRFCILRVAEAEAVYEGRAFPTRCSEGALPPGGELTLTMP